MRKMNGHLVNTVRHTYTQTDRESERQKENTLNYLAHCNSHTVLYSNMFVCLRGQGGRGLGRWVGLTELKKQL